MMTEQEALNLMVAPGTRRPGKFREGVIQIWVTRACDKACFGCTQGSNLGGKTEFITPDQFRQACQSLKGYWGVVGMFGGNPAMHPEFPTLCGILRAHFPREQCGLWCNNIRTRNNAVAAAMTFDPRVCNLNVHMDKEAYVNFKTWWPESMPFGLDKDSRHSPPYVAMKDVLRKDCERCLLERQAGLQDDGGSACQDCKGTGKVYDESKAWELISSCDINRHWSAMIGVFRGQLRAWFCEIAGAQAMLHQWDTDEVKDAGECTTSTDPETRFSYPDTGLALVEYDWYHRDKPGDPIPQKVQWWQLPMHAFADQVRKHCHECGVPLRGRGQLAILGDNDPHAVEQVSETHAGIYNPKRRGRRVELITVDNAANLGHVDRVIDYMKNASK